MDDTGLGLTRSPGNTHSRSDLNYPLLTTHTDCTMDLTQQSVLSFLVEEGGKVKKSELVRRFKGSVDCDDPEERERNRDVFKNFVNNVAVVKEIDGSRFVVVRKKYEPLVESYQVQNRSGDRSEDVDAVRKGELQRPPAPSEASNDEGENPTQMISPIEMALQRTKSDFKLKRCINLSIQNEEAKPESNTQSKPYALPLRMPPTKLQIHKLKSEDGPQSPTLEASQDMKRSKSVDSRAGMGSPTLRKSSKSTKASTDLKENRMPSMVPLEQAEHEWLVKCASGHWSQVYGLLLNDSHLAEKKDFMSGFTALHWAAKCGNSDMLVKIMGLSKAGGVELDVNAKAHGGYTPLHIAALHDQEYILAMLIGEYGADPRIRDNCGRRAYHYLHKAVSETIREMLGEPKTTKEPKVVQYEKEELDVFPDLSKSLQSISKLFQPSLSGHKKRPKHRPSLYSLQDTAEEQVEGGTGRHRLSSDVFI